MGWDSYLPLEKSGQSVIDRNLPYRLLRGQPLKTWDGSQIEKAHLQFCKRYLEINNKASNIACIEQSLVVFLFYSQSKTAQIHFVYTV